MVERVKRILACVFGVSSSLLGQENEVTRAIVIDFLNQFDEYTVSDVIFVVAGPAGLTAGKDLSRNGVKVLIVERNDYLGGGFWLGGYFMNKITVRAPGQVVLEELGVLLTRGRDKELFNLNK